MQESSGTSGNPDRASLSVRMLAFVQTGQGLNHLKKVTIPTESGSGPSDKISICLAKIQPPQHRHGYTIFRRLEARLRCVYGHHSGRQRLNERCLHEDAKRRDNPHIRTPEINAPKALPPDVQRQRRPRPIKKNVFEKPVCEAICVHTGEWPCPSRLQALPQSICLRKFHAC